MAITIFIDLFPCSGGFDPRNGPVWRQAIRVLAMAGAFAAIGQSSLVPILPNAP
jgi:hypothetical protein